MNTLSNVKVGRKRKKGNRLSTVKVGRKRKNKLCTEKEERVRKKIKWGRPDLNWSFQLPELEGWTKLPYGPDCVCCST